MNPVAGRLVFSVNSFAAAMLALYIAFAIGLPRPYWAMLTVYITSQPLTGALRSKAAYRVVGTGVGAMAAIVIVPSLVDSPLLMALALAGWTGLCLYLSLLDRSPRAYVFMLAGYTAAIIGFPSVVAPEAIFDTALARVEEITLGIVCATLVHTVVFPRDVGRVLRGRIAEVLADAQRWIGDALTGRAAAAGADDRRRLAAVVTELHLTSTHLPFDTASAPLRLGTVRALEGRLAYLLPLIEAVEDRLTLLGQLGKPDDAARDLLRDVAAWAARWDSGMAPADEARRHDEGRRLADLCRARAAALGAGVIDWRTLLVINLMVRLEELIDALGDCRDLARGQDLPGADIAGRVAALVRASGRPRLHLDHGVAALSGLALMAAVMGCCGIWIWTAWPEGAIAATMAAVFSSFFAAQDDPAPAIVTFLVWSVLALPLAALYLFAILPAIDGFPMLALALAPAMIGVGSLMAVPAWTQRGLALLIGFAGALAPQARFDADFAGFANAALAQTVGVAMALATARLMRTVGAGWMSRRILRRGWVELARLARRPAAVDSGAWVSAMLDRVGLVEARASLTAPEDGLDLNDGLADMRVGLNVIELAAVAESLDPAPGAGERSAAAQAIARAIDAVAAAFEVRLGRRPAQTGGGLLGAIDQAIVDMSGAAPALARARGLAALVGLRRALLADAPPFAARLEGAA